MSTPDAPKEFFDVDQCFAWCMGDRTDLNIKHEREWLAKWRKVLKGGDKPKPTYSTRNDRVTISEEHKEFIQLLITTGKAKNAKTALSLCLTFCQVISELNNQTTDSK